MFSVRGFMLRGYVYRERDLRTRLMIWVPGPRAMASESFRLCGGESSDFSCAGACGGAGALSAFDLCVSGESGLAGLEDVVSRAGGDLGGLYVWGGFLCVHIEVFATT